MTYLLGLSLFLIPYGIGSGMLCILYRGSDRQDLTKADALIAGWITVIGLAEIAHLAALASGRSFSDCAKYMLGLLFAALLLLGGTALYHAHKKRTGSRWKKTRAKQIAGSTEDILKWLFGIVVMIQVVLLIMERRMYLVGDLTVETVSTMLTTDTLYEINPMTGFPYEAGMPLRIKILCLPTLYAAFSKWTGLAATQVVWVVVPVVTLLGSYIAYDVVAGVLFPEQRNRMLFLLFVALLFQVGGYLYGMDGFGLQFAGWQGVTIRGGILLPYMVAALLRRRRMLACLCILAEACIVWTLYGMGMCLLVAALMTGVNFVRERFLTRRKGGAA